MNTDFRALCAELTEQLHQYAEVFPEHNMDALVKHARAALAEEPAAPEGRYTRLPSDEELRDLWSWAAGQDQGSWPTQQHCFARAVLARWGTPAPTPPADGEVAELVDEARYLVRELRDQADDLSPSLELFGLIHQAAVSLTRAAELLQRQALVPVSVKERPWEREGWCDGSDRCWWGRSESDDWSADWTLATPEAVAEFCEFSPRTVCLPAHALPIPQQPETTND